MPNPEIKIEAKELKEIVRRLAPAESVNTSLNFPIGEVAAEGQLITIVDLNQALKGDLSPLTVNSSLLRKTANRTSGTVVVSVGGDTLKLKSAKAEWTVAGRTPDKRVTPKPDAVLKAPLSAVKDVMDFAAIAGKSKNQFTYGGLLKLAGGSGKISAVATDGRCLVVQFSDTAAGDAFDVLVPASVIPALKSLSGEDLFLGETQGAVLFATGNSSASTTIIARRNTRLEFPNWSSVISPEPAAVLSLKTEAMLEAVRNVDPAVASGQDQDPVVELRLEDDFLKLSASSELDGAAARDEVEYEQIFPDPVFDDSIQFTACVNHKHLLEFLAVADETTRIESTPDKPLVLKSGSKTMALIQFRKV